MKKYLLLLLLYSVSSVEAWFSTVGVYSTQESATVTVWVHGTHPVKRLATCKMSPLRKQMYAPEGLSLADELPENYYFRSIASQCDQKDHVAYPLEHFYLFGWNSAKVTSKQRRKAGENLYKELSRLLSQYHKKYRKINLRLIGFSHGGNVILNCINCLPFKTRDIKTEVILLATPIQESTRLYVNSPYIHKVYSFYSDGDWIQRVDIQKLHNDAPRHSPFWSKRTFADTDNVIQIKLTVNGKKIGHLQYRNLMHHLPELMKQVNTMLNDEDSTQKHVDVDFMMVGKL